MTLTLPFLHSAAAIITYAPTAYVRIEWQPGPSSSQELRTVYEQVLQAMRRHGATALMSVHKQHAPMPPDVQAWLATDWIPRAIADYGYGRCAIVEADAPLSRPQSDAVGVAIAASLNVQFFRSETEAEAWLLT